MKKLESVRKVALGYGVILTLAAALNHIPGLTDAEGRAFGIFALDLFDDSLHLASALWAVTAGFLSARASRIFLATFGAFYLADGLLGLATGVGFLDFGIFVYGPQSLPLGFKVLANLPHIGLGAAALACGLRLGRSDG